MIPQSKLIILNLVFPNRIAIIKTNTAIVKASMKIVKRDVVYGIKVIAAICLKNRSITPIPINTKRGYSQFKTAPLSFNGAVCHGIEHRMAIKPIPIPNNLRLETGSLRSKKANKRGMNNESRCARSVLTIPVCRTESPRMINRAGNNTASII